MECISPGLNADCSTCWLGGPELGIIPLYDLVLVFSSVTTCDLTELTLPQITTVDKTHTHTHTPSRHWRVKIKANRLWKKGTARGKLAIFYGFELESRHSQHSTDRQSAVFPAWGTKGQISDQPQAPENEEGSLSRRGSASGPVYKLGSNLWLILELQIHGNDFSWRWRVGVAGMNWDLGCHPKSRVWSQLSKKIPSHFETITVSRAPTMKHA